MMALATHLAERVRPCTTLYEVAVYYPVAAWACTAIVVFLFGQAMCGAPGGLVAVALFALLPASVARTVAGYADRDALCLLLSALAILMYCQSKASPTGLIAWAWLLGSSVVFVALGFTWEAVGVFSAVVVSAELVRLLAGGFRTSDLLRLAGWQAVCVAGLVGGSRAYRVNANLSSPSALPAIVYPAYVVAVATAAMLARSRTRRARLWGMPSEALAVAALALLTGIGIAVAAVLSSAARDYAALVWDNILSPLGNSRLMRGIGELQQSSTPYLAARFGAVYVAAGVGFAIMPHRTCRAFRLPPRAPVLTSLAYIALAYTRGTSVYESLRGAGLVYGCVSAFCVVTCIHALMRRAPDTPPSTDGPARRRAFLRLVVLVWFVIALTLTHGARRYSFFLSVPVALLAADALVALFMFTSRWAASNTLGRATAPVTAFVVGIGVLFPPPLGAYVQVASVTARDARPLFANDECRAAFSWMKGNLPANAVVAADWNYGSHLNVLAGVSTVVDEDHYLPYWIHLSGRHFLGAQSDGEALDFLGTRNATHVLLAREDLAAATHISLVGSDAELDRLFEVIPLGQWEGDQAGTLRPLEQPRQTPLTIAGQAYAPGEFSLSAFRIDLLPASPTPTLATVSTASGTVDLPVRHGYIEGRTWVYGQQGQDGIFPGAVVMVRGESEDFHHAYYVGEAGYESLLVRLLLRGHGSRYFHRIYPPAGEDGVGVGVWRIDYPDGMASPRGYMEPDFPPGPLRAAWLQGD